MKSTSLTVTTAQWPGHDHQQLLRQRCATFEKQKDGSQKTAGYDPNKLTEIERWQWYAYGYALRRLALQTRDDCLPTDPLKAWFDGDLAAQAEIAFSRELGIKAPNL